MGGGKSGNGDESAVYYRVYILIKRLRVVNRTGSPINFWMWLGADDASADGPKVFGQGLVIPANDYA